MSGGTSHAQPRRILDPEFAARYFVGEGVDFGCGRDPLGQYAECYPLMTYCEGFDKELNHGNAQDTDAFRPGTLDFIHSSHLLEHVADPYATIAHWLTLLKPGGYLISIVPDEDMYEQGVWPSRFNTDHKHTFCISKAGSWSPVALPLAEMLPDFGCIIERIVRLTAGFEPGLVQQRDQSTEGKEVGIEFVLRKPGGVVI
jgi:SAM-dependent methyltransferase